MDRVPPELFRFSVGENAEVYTAILHAFAEANERLETSLSLEAVRERLRTVGWFDALTDDDLARALTSLRDWRLIDIIQNPDQLSTVVLAAGRARRVGGRGTGRRIAAERYGGRHGRTACRLCRRVTPAPAARYPEASA